MFIIFKIFIVNMSSIGLYVWGFIGGGGVLGTTKIIDMHNQLFQLRLEKLGLFIVFSHYDVMFRMHFEKIQMLRYA